MSARKGRPKKTGKIATVQDDWHISASVSDGFFSSHTTWVDGLWGRQCWEQSPSHFKIRSGLWLPEAPECAEVYEAF